MPESAQAMASLDACFVLAADAFTVCAIVPPGVRLGGSDKTSFKLSLVRRRREPTERDRAQPCLASDTSSHVNGVLSPVGSTDHLRNA